MKNLDQKVRFHKALGEPTRLKIVAFLVEKKECSCICHLSKKLNKDQSVIFRHIQILKEAGIIKTKKKDKFLYCCLENKKKIKNILEE